MQNKLELKARREWVNMKANRKFVEGEEAVSAVIGVILMVAITVAIAATVYVYVSGMLGTGPEKAPTISMQQTGEYINVLGVQSGPVNGSDATVIFINQTSGASTSGTINWGNGNADNVDGGDTITAPSSVTSDEPGQKYTVQVIYGGDVIGTTVYTVQ